MPLRLMHVFLIRMHGMTCLGNLQNDGFRMTTPLFYNVYLRRPFQLNVYIYSRSLKVTILLISCRRQRSPERSVRLGPRKAAHTTGGQGTSLVSTSCNCNKTHIAWSWIYHVVQQYPEGGRKPPSSWLLCYFSCL